jgi:hypothetical protein
MAKLTGKNLVFQSVVVFLSFPKCSKSELVLLASISLTMSGSAAVESQLALVHSFWLYRASRIAHRLSTSLLSRNCLSPRRPTLSLNSHLTSCLKIKELRTLSSNLMLFFW